MRAPRTRTPTTATNTTDKITTITQTAECLHLLYRYDSGPPKVSPDGSALFTPTYYIHPLDLRTLHTTSSDKPPETFKHIDPTLPTLIISECCLIYLAPHLADKTATYFTRTFFPPTTPLGLILYEPINPYSPFGKVMVRNLATRGIVLQTLYQYDSLEAQRARLRAYGFEEGQEAQTVDGVWEDVGGEEKGRVAGLEMVDEVEEWRLLAGHYCVAWGWRDGDGDGDGDKEMEGEGKGKGNGKGTWDLWREKGCAWDR